jgi:hypothetical protein
MKSLARTQDHAELVERLGKLTPQADGRWGQMTAPQMVCHLADACRMALGRKQVSNDSSALRRTIIKWLALYAPLQWRAGIVTSPEIDQQIAGTCPSDFASDLAQVRVLLDAIATKGLRGTWPDHPVFGRMSPSEWLRWAYLHTDHHLRQFGI